MKTYLDMVNERLRSCIKNSEKSILNICTECGGTISYPTLQQFCKSEKRKIDKLSHIWALCKVLDVDIMELLNPESELIFEAENREVEPEAEPKPMWVEDVVIDKKDIPVLTEKNPFYKWNCSDVIRFIEEHYMEKLSLESIADHYYINKYHLAKTFKKRYGMTVFQYIKKVRIDRARQLLLSTDYAISQVAKLCGYDDVSYFYRIFKETTGTTAKECRNSRKNTKL